MTDAVKKSIQDSPEQAPAPVLRQTPLHRLHESFGAKMVGFAGYAMPVSYPLGVLKEHLHTRASVGLFDVSHMGQAWLEGVDGADPAAALESLVPADLAGLGLNRQRYSQLLNEAGGIRDDLMIARTDAALGRDGLFLVVNAACKDADFAHIDSALTGRARLTRIEDRTLIAVQGPKAASLMSTHAPELATLPFMALTRVDILGVDCLISRSGYTGEDGYEVSLPADAAEDFARALLDQDGVAMIGLGARDSLRLEAGLCLYGHDLDETTTPIEAGLTWSIGKRRREAGGFPGAAIIQQQLAEGVARKRVGIRPEGRAPAREGTEIRDRDDAAIGTVTSGGFGPTVGGPIAMGYVAAAHAAPGTSVFLSVRGKSLPAEVVKTPFVPQRYYRG